MDTFEKLTKLKPKERKGYCSVDSMGRPTPSYIYEVPEELFEETIKYFFDKNKESIDYIKTTQTKISEINEKIRFLEANLNWYKATSYFLSFVIIIYTLINIIW